MLMWTQQIISDGEFGNSNLPVIGVLYSTVHHSTSTAQYQYVRFTVQVEKVVPRNTYDSTKQQSKIEVLVQLSLTDYY